MAATVLTLTLSAWGLGQLKTVLALEDVVDNSFASKRRLNALMHDFHVHNSAFLVISRPASGWTESELCSLTKWLNLQRLNNPDLLSSFSPAEVRTSVVQPSFIKYPRVLRLSCLEERSLPGLTPARIEEQMKQIGATPWGLATVGKDAQSWMIEIALQEAPPATRFGTFDPKAVARLHDSFKTEIQEKMPELRASWIGTADFQYYLYIGLQRVNLLNLGLLAAFLIAFRLLFGTWRSGLMYSASLLLIGLICYGLMGAAKIPIDILSKSLFLMIAVAALEDFVFLAVRTSDRNGDWRSAWRQLCLPGFLTSLTSFLGFISLCTSDLQVIRRFGAWAAVASLLEWLVLFMFLPALFTLAPPLAKITHPKKPWGLKLFQRLRLRQWPRQLSYLSLMVFFFLPLSLTHLDVNDDPLAMFTSDHPFKIGMQGLEKSDGWQAQASLIFPANIESTEEAQVVQTLQRQPDVTAIRGASSYLDFLATPATTPETKALILREAASASFMKNWMSPKGERRFALFLRSSDTAAVDRVLQTATQLCLKSGCYLAGVPVVYSEFSRLVPKTLLDSFTLSLILVGSVLAALAAQRGFAKAIPVLLVTSFWGTTVMFVVIYALSLKINFLICLFASVLVGLTGDNAIQFLCASKAPDLQGGLQRQGSAALITGSVMALTCLIFLGSYFVPPRTFGLLLMAGFFASTIGDYWIFKGLLLPKAKLGGD